MGTTKARSLSYILVAYCAVIAIASLYPFSGWTAPTGLKDHFLTAPWPRYITRNDISTNLLAYLPFGYLLAVRLFRPGRRAIPILLACLAGGLMSLAMESLQAWLPGRVASNLDIFLNSLGALIGGLLALHHARWLRTWRNLQHWRVDWFLPHGVATLGLWLLLLWGLTQFALVPQPGVGWLELHLRPIDMPPDRFQQLNLPWFFAMFLEISALGAFAACLLRPGRYASAIFLLTLSAFALKLLVAAVMLKLRVLGGILSLETLAAFVLALWLLLLPSVSRHRQAVAFTLLTVIVLGRLWWVPSPLWPSGSLLNLIGLARHLAALWPWLALAYLVERIVGAARIQRLLLDRRRGRG
ncbi:MAG: VanZ family protein [Gallionellaceae bacterium]|nr:VanZ family protein [Gallionellaceae bacterium]